MRKTDKKTEREIIRRLTLVCEDAKQSSPGFVWLTHEVDYRRFPHSLKVVLVFNQDIPETQLLAELRALIPQVQAALQPLLEQMLPAKQIEGRREHSLH